MWEYDGEGHEYDGEEVFREEEAHDVEFRVLGLLRYPSGATRVVRVCTMYSNTSYLLVGS